MWSAVARSGLCGLMGVCVVVPGGGVRQTVDPFTKIPRNLAWGCAQVVDGLFMRLLSRPLGVVRIRWGICRPGWCGCCVVVDVPRGRCLGLRYAALAGALVCGMGLSRGVHSSYEAYPR